MKTAIRLVSIASVILALAPFARATVTETFKQTYPLAADGVVSVENVNGSVEITAWDRPEVALEAVKSAPDDEDLKRIHVVIEAAPSRLSIKTQYEKKHSFFGDSRGDVAYKLMIPAGASLKGVDVVNCDVIVRGVKGATDLHSVNGKIDATGLAAAGKLSTVNGSIVAQFDRVADKISLESVNGSCRLEVPKDAGFELRASSVNGSTSCSLPVTLEKSGHHNLRGTVGAGGPEVSLESVNGSLEVKAK